MEYKWIFDYKPSILGIPHLWKTPHIKLEGRPFSGGYHSAFRGQRPGWILLAQSFRKGLRSGWRQLRICSWGVMMVMVIASFKFVDSNIIYIYAMMYMHDTSDICNYIYMYIYICICIYIYMYMYMYYIKNVYIYIIYIQLSMYLSIYSVHSCSIHPKKQTYGLPSGLDEHPPYTEHDFKKKTIYFLGCFDCSML